MKAKPWPSELLFKRAEKRLRISFDDGCAFEIPFELLRVESPSAEVRGHGGAALPAIVRARTSARYSQVCASASWYDSNPAKEVTSMPWLPDGRRRESTE